MNTEKVANHIVIWLKNYAVNAKVNGFVVWSIRRDRFSHYICPMRPNRFANPLSGNAYTQGKPSSEGPMSISPVLRKIIEMYNLNWRI